MWLLILFSAGIAGCAIATLEGEHICPQEEKYTVNVTRLVLHTVKIRNYKWCMSVPPRCSYYTDEEKYIPKTVEEEESRIVDKCCPGYQEDENGEKCIPNCFSCIHGECELNNKCNCHPGFWGDDCDKECLATRWGRNCEFDCSCKRGDCDRVSGYCLCPPGWKGNRCEEWLTTTSLEIQSNPITTPITRVTTEQKFSTITQSGDLENLEQRLKSLSERTKYPIFQKYYTFYITTQNPYLTTKLKPGRLNEVGNWEPPGIHSATEKNTPETINITLGKANLTSVTRLSGENLEETTIYNHIKSLSINAQQRHGDLTSQPSAEVDTMLVPVARMTTTRREDDEAKQEPEFVNNKITDQVVSVTQPSHANMKAKVVDGLEVSVTSTQPIFAKEEDWLNDESRVGPETEATIHQNQTPINDSHLVFSIGAAAGVTATIILIVAVVLLTTQNYRRKKFSSIVAVATTTKNENGDGVPAVEIYTRSVFHAPLPEPPIFENPVFTTPLEYENTTNEFGGTLETHVICNMHLPHNHCNYRRDSRIIDAFYDHPPSTGSYRAASIPEPPEQTLEVANSELKEHLYDEIPCWKQPLSIMQPAYSLPKETLSYYANTTTNNKN